MRDQNKSITDIEHKRESLIGLSNYTFEDLNVMTDLEIENIYNKIIKKLDM